MTNLGRLGTLARIDPVAGSIAEVTDEEILNEPRNDRANVDPEGPFFWCKFRFSQLLAMLN